MCCKCDIFTDNSDESIGLKFIPSQSELFRFIPIPVSESMRIIPNQSEKRFVYRLMENGQKSIWLNLINSEKPIRMNPNQSETKFAIQINPNQSDLGLMKTEFSIRINANESKVGMNRIDSDWKFGLHQSEIGLIRIDLDCKLGLGLVLIHSDWCLGLNRIKSNWFMTGFHQTRYKTFFGLVRNDSHWLGFRYRNESE